MGYCDDVSFRQPKNENTAQASRGRGEGLQVGLTEYVMRRILLCFQLLLPTLAQAAPFVQVATGLQVYKWA